MEPNQQKKETSKIEPEIEIKNKVTVATEEGKRDKEGKKGKGLVKEHI